MKIIKDRIVYSIAASVMFFFTAHLHFLFVDQLIHNVPSPIDVWNWSRRFPNSEDDAHARLHISIKIPVCEDDGLATATPK